MKQSSYRPRDSFANVSWEMVRELGGDVTLAAIFDWIVWKADFRYEGIRDLEGTVWYSASTREMSGELHISEDKIGRALARLVKLGHLRTMNLRTLGPYDRTLSYAPVWDTDARPEGQIDSVNPQNAFRDSAESTFRKSAESSFSHDVQDTGSDQGQPSTSTEKLFDQFWAKYPRRVKKAEAQKRFAIALRRAPFEKIMGGLDRYVRSVAGKEPEFIAHPTAWLNQQRWDDEDTSTATAVDPYANRRRFGQPVNA